MKRSIISLLFAMILMTGTLNCLAEPVGDYKINITEGGTCIIYSYYGSEVDLVIPSTVDMYDETFPVTTIKEMAFIYNTDLKTIIIPDGVSYIGYRAFYGCENLETVMLPSTIQQIEDEAFAYCTSLAQINLPDSLYYAGENIFTGCDMLNLTQEEKDVLINTEYAAWEAQQKAFVVNTENLIELSVYLGTSFDDFVNMMGDMHDQGYTDGIGYTNNEVSIYSGCIFSDNKMMIESIDIHQKSNYCLMGVYVSMDSQDAMRTLLKAGWKMVDKWEMGSSFVDPNGNDISYWINDDNTINDIVLNINGDIAYEMSENNYDIVDLFVYTNSKTISERASTPDNITSSTAYTTGNVNLRIGPGLGYDTVSSIPSGIYIDYLDESFSDERGVTWYYVRYGDIIGWASSKYVELM